MSYRTLGYMGMMREIGSPDGMGQAAPALDPLVALAAEKLTPLASTLGSAIRPFIAAEIEQRLPRFAIITGLVAGGLVAAGLWAGLWTAGRKR